MAIIGMDIHRSFAQVAFLQNRQIEREMRVPLVHDCLVVFAVTTLCTEPQSAPNMITKGIAIHRV